MVLLTMTPAVAAAVKVYLNSDEHEQRPDEPSLDAPEAGNPIAHGQLINISKYLKAHPERSKGKGSDGKDVPVYLNELMRRCYIYSPPPKPKAEPTTEYKLLMARLRREEEARSYERMLNPSPPSETLTQRFPTASYGHLYPPPSQQQGEDDEMTYADINRQMALIANVLISIIACSVAIWKVAWHWNTPQRLALSMAGSLVVAVAEVAIYAGYIGRVSEAKAKEKKKVERKVVKESWVIEAKGGKKSDTIRHVKGSASNVPFDEPSSGLRLREGRGRT